MLEIKSKIILKKIFKNIENKIWLKTIKYNKNLQNKLDISIEDYKKYNQIEFEIEPNNKFDKIFINCKVEFDPFIHISIDNNKNYLNTFIIDDVFCLKKIKIIIDPEIKSLKGFFKNSEYIEELKCMKFNRRDITDLSEMFSGCKYLKYLDISKFKTDNVTDMSYMIYQILIQKK